MQDMKNKIEQIIQDIKEISDYLYQQKVSQGYAKLNITLGNIINIIEDIFIYIKDNKVPFDENRLTSNLTLAMQAMEDRDTVLLADLLVYEIAEQFKEIDSLI